MPQQASKVTSTNKVQPWKEWFTPSKEKAHVVHRAVETYEDQQNGWMPTSGSATIFEQ